MDRTEPSDGKEKLIAAKKQWARDGRLLTGETHPHRDAGRLPPGQRLVTSWPVLDIGVTPTIRPESWRLDVGGLVQRPASFDQATFAALPQTAQRSDIHCVTSWSRFDNDWLGVAATDLIADVKPLERARFVQLEAYDGYTTNLPLDSFARSDVVLATHWQGQKLSVEHGAPVRLVVPQLYFWKSAKWLRRIDFAETDRPGFWEQRGYHNLGDPWQEQRYG
ncbi:MAG: sulfite oxidase-like oxidoreductase [Rhodospirillaceae bacterium]|nr:sulfite oxidase-like oxidoreductase [Rhodospirillaceae bacterium]